MKKVLVNFNLEDNLKRDLSEKFNNYNFIFSGSEKELYDNIEDSEILITIGLNENMLKHSNSLKWIHTIRAGVDGWPLDQILNKNIILTNGRGVHKMHMSEFAIGALITLARNFHIIFKNKDNAFWDQGVEQGQISGATLGILGLGNIGKEIARKANFMGMKVIGTKKTKKCIDYVDRVYSDTEMEEVFRKSDYIINLLPVTTETYELIDRNFFDIMKKSACFINLGRGKTVNEGDLIESLKNRKIRAAFLDVFQEEPLKKDSDFWNLDNVIITPHLSGETLRYNEMAMEILKINLEEYWEDKASMINIVDLKRGY